MYMINFGKASGLRNLVWCAALIWLSLSGVACGKSETPAIITTPPPTAKTFSNPLINGADPSVFQKDQTYYYMHTTGNSIRLWKTSALSKLNDATPQTLFTPIPGSGNSRNVWAPEIYFMDGKWYIYYTAGNGQDISQRTWVLENSNPDPMTGTWIDKGRIYNPDTDFWAIDGTILEHNGNRYFLWCGRPDVKNIDLTQNIYISKMSNPWTLEGSTTKLSVPEFAWEKNGFAVNEAPQILKAANNQIYMVYSASYCGTDDYALGMMTLKAGGNPLVLADWAKRSQPVFSKKPQSNAFGPGHSSFFMSPDKAESWMIYHANSFTNQGCGEQRNIRMQKITFSADGSPNLGEPVANGLQINKPSGD